MIGCNIEPTNQPPDITRLFRERIVFSRKIEKQQIVFLSYSCMYIKAQKFDLNCVLLKSRS